MNLKSVHIIQFNNFLHLLIKIKFKYMQLKILTSISFFEKDFVSYKDNDPSITSHFVTININIISISLR